MYGDAAFSATSALNINSAFLYLDNQNSLKDNADRIADTAVVNLRGGFLELRGRDQSATAETLGTVNLVAGGSQFVSVVSGQPGDTVTLSLTDLNRSRGSIVNFRTGLTNRVMIGAIDGVATSAPATLTNGILGGWAVVDDSVTGAHDFASYSAANGVGAMGAAGYPSYSNATTAANTLANASAASNISLASATGFTIAVADDLAINSLRFADQATQTVDIAAGKTLTLGTGGLLSWGVNPQYVGGADGQGNLTSGGAELFAYAQGAGLHEIRANIVNPSLLVDMALVKGGTGTWRMTGTNTYTGGTFVNNGALILGASAGSIPLADDPTKGLVVNGSWQGPGQFVAQRAGSIALGNEVTVNGNGSVVLFGDNTIAKLTFNNDGSNAAGFLRTFADTDPAGAGSRGVLTIGTGGLWATSSNVTTLSVIEGRVDFGATANTVDVAPISGGGFTDVDPLRATLALQAVVGSAGGITKNGNGVLQFNAQSSFGSAFTVAGGGIKTGVINAGSRQSTLVLNAGTRFDLNNLGTTWGGLAGSGDVFSSLGTPTLNVGFNNANTTFAGRFMRFNDAAYGQLNKIGAGRLTLTADQPSTGSFGAISVSGGTLAYAGAGQAFESTLSARSVFNVNTGGVLLLDNLGANLSHRLGAVAGGQVNLQGGLLALGGSAAGATEEGVALLAVQNGGGRIELTPDSVNTLALNIGTLAFANVSLAATTVNASNIVTVTSTAGLVPGMLVSGPGINAGTTIAAITDGTNLVLSANATAAGSITMTAVQTSGSLVIAGLGGQASALISNPNFTANQGAGLNGATSMSVRGDILVDASASGLGTGFLTLDSLTSRVRALDLLTETTVLADTLGGIYNARLTADTLLRAPTTVNTLTTSGNVTVSSGLAASVFGKYGPSGDLLSLTLANAAGLLVKDGTTNFDMGTLVGPAAGPAYFHVMPGATLRVNAALIPATGGGFVLDNGGTMELLATTGFTTGNIVINSGTLRLNSGADNTLAISATAGAMGLPLVALNGPSAVLDIGARNQTVRGLSSSNPLPGMGGTVTGLAGAVFTTTDNSTFGGRLTGGLSLVRSGNSTTTLTSASDYAGTTVVRGGTLELRDGGSIASTAGIRLAQGILLLNNFGLNAVDNPQRIAANNLITMAGGTLGLTGGGSADNTLTVNQITLERGSNQLNTNPYLNMGATNRIEVGNLVVASVGVRPTANFNGWTTPNTAPGTTGTNTLGNPGLSASSIVKLNSLNGAAFSAASMTNNLIGGWAVADGSTFATYTDDYGIVQMGTTRNGVVAPAFDGTDISQATVATGNYDDGAIRTITGTKLANSLRFAPTVAQTITFNSANLVLGVGIITNPEAVAITLQAADASSSITSAGSDLYVFTNGNTMTFNVRLTGNMNLIKSGTGTLALGSSSTGASNTYGGTTYVNAGTLNLTAPAGIIAVPGDLVITGLASGTNSAVTMVTNAGQIAATANVTLLGGGNLTLVGTNTLRGLTFDNEGAMANPTVAAASLTLSQTAAITATNQSPVSVPVISGTALDFGSNNPVITVNAGLAATGLTISAPITQNAAMLSLTKSGAGVLALSGQSTFTTGLTLAAGALMLGADSVVASGAITSGPVGRGTLVVGAGTSLFSDGTVRTIANPLTVSGDFALGGRGAGSGVNLAGMVSLGSVMRTISVTNYGVTATLDGGLSTGLADRSIALTKTGNGVLVLAKPSTSLDLKGAGIKVSGGVIRWGGLITELADRLPADSFLTADVASGFDLAGFNQSTHQILGTGFFTNSSRTTASTLTVGGDNSSFTFSGALTDNVAGGGATLNLTKVGSGVLSFGAVNNYGGLTDIQAGRLDITNIGSFGLGPVSIALLAELRLDRTGTLNFPNSLSGAGDVRSVGTGTTILTDTNGGFTGNFLVDNGILQVGNGTLLGDMGDLGSAQQVIVTLPGQLRFNYSTDYTLPRPIRGTGSVVQQSTRVLSMGGSYGLTPFSGRVQVNNGTLEVNSAGILAASAGITVNRGNYYNIDANEVQVGSFFKVTGADTVGTSSYGVPLTLNGGTADVMTNSAYLGLITLNGGDLTSDQVNPNSVGSWIFLGNVNVTDDSTITAQGIRFGATSASRDFSVADGKTLTFSGSFGDGGPAVASYSKSGAGTLVLTGSAKTNSGTVTLNGGFLKFADDAQLGTSSAAVHGNLVFAGGSVEYTGAGSYGRNFLVRDGGAGFHSNRLVDPLAINGVGQIDFDDVTTAAARPLTLSGASMLANTFSAGLLDNADASRAFSAIVKNGVGQWIVDGAGAALAPDADVNVNGGVLGFYLNALGATASNGDINLANNTTLRWESTNNQDLGARLKVADGATATIQVENNTTFNGGLDFAAGANTGTGALVKTGAGNLTLAGSAGTFSGGLTVAEGTVTVNQAGALGSGTTTIAGGTTLVVNNAVTNNIVVSSAGVAPSGGQLVASAAVGNVTVASGATIGRGPTIGSFTATGTSLAGGARLEFKIWDINGESAGVGYDQYAFGNLNLSGASVNNKITIKLISMSTASTLGAAGDLTQMQGLAGIQTFSFGSFNAGGLTLGGNSSANISDLFTFDTSQFTYTGGTASAASLWAIDFNTNSGAITLTAVPEPSTYGLGLGALALAAAAIRRRRQTKKA